MTIAQYKKWISKNFKEADPNEFLKKAINFGNFKIKGVENNIESSFNSFNRLDLLKITHIFHLQHKKMAIFPSDFIKVGGFIKLVDSINKKLKLKFNTQILQKILNLPITSMVEDQNLVINFDFKKGKIIKISIALNPQDLGQFFKIFSKNLSVFSKIENDKLAFINVDFYPNGIIVPKTYYLYKPFDYILKKKTCVRRLKIFDILLNKIPPDFIFIMKKLKTNFSWGGIYLNYCNSFKKIEEFLKFKYFQNNSFFKSICPLIKGFKISFLAFKPKNMIEIYFK